jgi:thioredoxin 1
LLLLFGLSAAFSPVARRSLASSRFILSVVSEINSIADLETAKAAAGDKLMVVDYSTTWCGPCKIVMPKFVALSDRYPEVLFYKCVGDLTPDGAALMKAEGVRSVPAFHFWKGGSKIDTISGARIDDVEATVKSSK